MKPYLYFKGLIKLVGDIKGNEVIHLGIRPYGFHAGNAMALLVYPYLLCKYFKKSGKLPRFKFVVSINDWEQDALDGPNFREYPFNIFPKNTSLYFMPDEKKCCKSSIAHWQPVIENQILTLKRKFPHISLLFVRNSSLIKHSFCRKLLIETIKDPFSQLKILKKHSDKKVLKAPVIFAGAICPKCHRAHGITKVVNKNMIYWECSECKYKIQKRINCFQYWWYHKPMLIARIKILNIDITLSGGDHYSEGDYKIRRAFLKKYCPNMKEPRMLFTPTIIAQDGQKMSKSRNNIEFADIPNLIKKADGFMGKDLLLTDNLILKNVDEKNYSYIL